jgi:hypothetical protein
VDGAGSKRKWDLIVANVRDIEDAACTLPSSGILEFDFVSCFLRAQCRNTTVATPYLPSEYQLKVLLTQLPKASLAKALTFFNRKSVEITPDVLQFQGKFDGTACWFGGTGTES